jgi:hypothetical protein
MQDRVTAFARTIGLDYLGGYGTTASLTGLLSG